MAMDMEKSVYDKTQLKTWKRNDKSRINFYKKFQRWFMAY